MGVGGPMPDLVFWDTAAFVALGNQDDAWHSVAVQVSVELERTQSLVLTTDAVLTEVANTFRRTPWRPVAQRLIQAVWQSVEMGVAQVVHIDEALWQRGWQLFHQRPDKDWSLTDCFSFVVMREHQVSRAFTTDRHFAQAGLIPLMRQ
jgi:predicted nucleic acid-binding protein